MNEDYAADYLLNNPEPGFVFASLRVLLFYREENVYIEILIKFDSDQI